MDLRSQSTADLLRLYASILDELARRQVVRTRNAPAGDYAEYLVSIALDGKLEPNSNRSWDVTTGSGKRVQVKSRVVGPLTAQSATFSVLRSFDFDECIFIKFDQGTYGVMSAVGLPAQSVQAIARFRSHVRGSSVRIGQNLLALDGARDLTDLVRTAASSPFG